MPAERQTDVYSYWFAHFLARSHARKESAHVFASLSLISHRLFALANPITNVSGRSIISSSSIAWISRTSQRRIVVIRIHLLMFCDTQKSVVKVLIEQRENQHSGKRAQKIHLHINYFVFYVINRCNIKYISDIKTVKNGYTWFFIFSQKYSALL